MADEPPHSSGALWSAGFSGVLWCEMNEEMYHTLVFGPILAFFAPFFVVCVDLDFRFASRNFIVRFMFGYLVVWIWCQ